MPRVSLSPIWHLAVLLQGTGWGVYFLTCAWMLHADSVSRELCAVYVQQKKG